jgi:hypothetical protein
MNFCPGSKNSINGKNARYDRIIQTKVLHPQALVTLADIGYPV